MQHHDEVKILLRSCRHLVFLISEGNKSEFLIMVKFGEHCGRNNGFRSGVKKNVANILVYFSVRK